MSDICVTHLVRAHNGVEPFERFIDSYRTHPAGVAHNLLIVFKAFPPNSDLTEYTKVLGELQFQTLFVEDSGVDILSYMRAVHNFDYKYFCFLNSFSLIEDGDWLAKMYTHVQRPGVGVVGASGSYESMLNNFVRSLRPGKQIFQLLTKNSNSVAAGAAPKARHGFNFPRFPNYHVRTNAFLIPRQLMLALKTNQLRSKLDGHKFESGRKSLTRQIFSMGLKALVVGRDGQAYEKDQWSESLTFRSGNQENLLVSDNQTRGYQFADLATRATLFENTWGRKNTSKAAVKSGQ